MPSVVLLWAVTFLCTVVLHVTVWRLQRPLDYRNWVPALLGIFVLGGGAIAAVLVRQAGAAGWPDIGGMAAWSAIMLLQVAMAAVYTIGYTLLLASSPSLVILERLALAPRGLRADEVGLPMTGDGIIGGRVDNLAQSGLVRNDEGQLRLTPKGRRLVAPVLLFRHVIGLPDGGGG